MHTKAYAILFLKASIIEKSPQFIQKIVIVIIKAVKIDYGIL